jgi:hypothetical protein
MGKGLGIRLNPDNLERPLIRTPCGYRDFDPEMIKNHEDVCPKCREMRKKAKERTT